MESLLFWIILIVLVLGIIWFIALYNTLVKFRHRVKEAWSDIEVQLKRRYDLIPNLVESVKGYATHEQNVFQKVTEARSQAMQAQTAKEHAKAENMLTETLKSLFAVSENYPSLQASQNFLDLQQNLTDAEDKIQAARRFYNANVRDFNIAIESFPSNIVAQLFGFAKEEFYDAPPETEATPQVKF
ncbi:hypothetical protein CO172_02040 [Candidatus Uhrbacteria bacterium CG_4_9_14_3_um_filter_36_7]|uniref:LemA family protein n=1 Tax=Candidatus Uhrbacteria bacterium CG_4_9_14_3_um_filter_36_7 TaxID=1975033 RepID=A0A2M7XHJ9_9BACT|nr:MAG: hypothetical protein CO172_02040 [Candidatus Uhrbacteria bacterium CG_4_9_14_3_um_filter_36_7]